MSSAIVSQVCFFVKDAILYSVKFAINCHQSIFSVRCYCSCFNLFISVYSLKQRYFLVIFHSLVLNEISNGRPLSLRSHYSRTCTLCRVKLRTDFLCVSRNHHFLTLCQLFFTVYVIWWGFLGFVLSFYVISPTPVTPLFSWKMEASGSSFLLSLSWPLLQAFMSSPFSKLTVTIPDSSGDNCITIVKHRRGPASYGSSEKCLATPTLLGSLWVTGWSFPGDCGSVIQLFFD